MSKHLRVLTAVGAAVALIALAVPGQASAGSWTWQGWLPGSGSAYSCIWYPGWETCSGWNYWYWTDTESAAYDPSGSYLVGYENNTTIRGVNLANDSEAGTTPANIGMGGYLKAQTLYWSGVNSNYFKACAVTSLPVCRWT